MNTQKNILLYYIFNILKEPLFLAPILIMCVKTFSGMSMSDIYIMESVMLVIGVVFLEIPSGLLADVWGRKNTLLAGIILFTICIGTLTIANSVLMVWIACFLWRISSTIISGADSAFLFDTLKNAGRENEFTKIQGRAVGFSVIAVCLCSIPVGYLAEINLRLPVALSFVLLGIGCVFAFFLREPEFKNAKCRNLNNGINLTKESVKIVLSSKKIIWVIGFTALFASISNAWLLTDNDYFALAGLPLEYYGILFSLYCIVSGLCGYYADKIINKIGNNGSIILTVILTAIPLMIMGNYVSQIVCLLIIMRGIANGYVLTFLDNILHKCTESSKRATILSIHRLVVSVLRFVTMISLGVLFNFVSIPTSLIIMSMVVTVFGTYFVLTYLKLSE